MYEKLAMYIDGQWCQGSDGAGEDVINPATEEALARLPHASLADLDRALAAARTGFAQWRATSAYDRGAILYKAGALIRERADAIARTLTLEQGKGLAEARMEVMVSADIFQWYAEEGRRAYGRIIPSRIPGSRQMVVREPVGPVAAFTPWNFPAVTPARKIAGALGAGCSCIIKPSEETPGTTIAMVRALEDAGLPAGIINVVFGIPSVVSEHLIASPVIRKVTFTGSIPVGKLLTKLAAEGMKRTTMELGGHAPVIVFDDVDVDKVSSIAVAGKFRNAGQVCVSPTRFFVQDKVYKSFVTQFSEKAAALKVGNGLEADTQMGPLANKRRVEVVESFVSDAVECGARLATGGERIGNQGFYYAPTVLDDVPDEARIMNEEPFGPLAPMQPFSNFDDVMEKANGLPFGLAAYAFTTSNERANRVSDALESGLVGVNHCAISFAETPFGGVKESGHGAEGGIEGLAPTGGFVNSNSVFLEIPLTSRFVAARIPPMALDLDTAALLLDQLGNQTRLRIVRSLVRAGDEGRSVGDMQREIGIPASTLSHHLSHLRGAGVVWQEREGTVLRCFVDFKMITALVQFLTSECCADMSATTGRRRAAG